MAEITFTLPGAIPYSNVVVKATPEELGLKELDAYALGVAHIVWLNLFNQGIQEGKGIDVSPPKGETKTPYTELLKEEIGDDSDLTYESNIAEQSMEETKAILEAGLGSTTEVPWKKAVKADPKPWEEPKSVENVANDSDMF